MASSIRWRARIIPLPVPRLTTDSGLRTGTRGDHPEMPNIVAPGKESAGIRACSLCHYPNGHGKMENAHVAGLPAEYILQQFDAFERGDRRNADRRKANTNEMSIMPKGLTDEEKQQIGRLFLLHAVPPVGCGWWKRKRCRRCA